MYLLQFQNIINSNYYYPPGWELLLMLLLVIILGYLYFTFKSRMIAFIKSVFTMRLSAQRYREERTLTHPMSLLLSLNFIFVMALFILQLSSSGLLFQNRIDFSFISLFILSIAILLIYSFKILFMRVFDFILNEYEAILEYIVTLFVMLQFLGILLLPIVIFIAYGPSVMNSGLIYTGVYIICILFIIRTIKGLRIVLSKKDTSLFYIILYLCSFEILPLLIGFRIMTNLVS